MKHIKGIKEYYQYYRYPKTEMVDLTKDIEDVLNTIFKPFDDFENLKVKQFKNQKFKIEVDFETDEKFIFLLGIKDGVLTIVSIHDKSTGFFDLKPIKLDWEEEDRMIILDTAFNKLANYITFNLGEH